MNLESEKIQPAVTGLAVLPVPVADADFYTLYTDLEERLTQPCEPLPLVASVVELGHASGVLADKDLVGLSNTADGIRRACALSQRSMDALIDEAQQRAKQMVTASGLTLPEQWCLSLDAFLDDSFGKGIGIEMGHNMHVADLGRFITQDLPGPLRRIALNAVYAMTLMGPMANLMSVQLDECEYTRMSYVYMVAGEWHEFFEGYAFGDMQHTLADACTAFQALYGDALDEDDYDQFACAWNAIYAVLGKGVDNVSIESSTAEALQVMVAEAREAGYTHPVLSYAEGIAALVPLMSSLEARARNAVDIEAVDAHQMLCVVVGDGEIDVVSTLADGYMQTDESPHLVITGMERWSWAGVRDALTLFCAQAIAFECMDAHGLLDPFETQSK